MMNKRFMCVAVLIMTFLNVTNAQNWVNVSADQVEMTAEHNIVNLKGLLCQWWLMDKTTHTRIGAMYAKTMPTNALQTSFNHYYDLQSIDLLKSGLIHPDTVYQACAVCPGTDTLEIDLKEVGTHAVVDHEVLHLVLWGNDYYYLGVEYFWTGSAYFVDSLVWDQGKGIASNIQATLWSGQPYNYANFGAPNASYGGLRYLLMSPRRYVIIRVVSDGGFLNYKVIDTIDGTIVYKTHSTFYGDQKVRKVLKDFIKAK